jgi:uncharacterized membrane protein
MTLSADDPPIRAVKQYVNIRPGHHIKFATILGAVPKTAQGTYYLLVFVNPGRLISEASLANNLAVSTSTITVLPPVIDLSGSFVTTPASLTPGKSTTAVIEVSNAGDIPSSKTITLSMTAQTSATPGSGRVELAVIKVRPTVVPGKPKRVKISFRVPKTLPAGTYFLAATLDSNDLFVSAAPFTAL